MKHPDKHLFSIDNELVYWNFFLDFGPLNLGHTYRFCQMLNNKLKDPRLTNRTIYYYSGSHPHKRTNAAFLICAWSVLYRGLTPEEAFRPFRGVQPGFPCWHDATPSVCTFQLTVLDTLRGLYKAQQCRYFDFHNFDLEEYEYYEQVENGDLNWCLAGKFIAFAGPHATRDALDGYHTLCPENYIPYFKRKNVTLVVRFNKKYYDAKRFTSAGIDHADLYFIDGTNPPEALLQRFLTLCEETPGAVAVHCKAGLGRTGTCIGCYMMKHHGFTAEEAIGWLRIVRPGSVIGPQQQFMKDVQAKMWREGELFRKTRGLTVSPNGHISEAKDKYDDMASNMHKLSFDSSVGRRSSGHGRRSDAKVATAVEEGNGVMTQGDILRLRRTQNGPSSHAIAPINGGAKTHAAGVSTSKPSSSYRSSLGSSLSSLTHRILPK